MMMMMMMMIWHKSMQYERSELIQELTTPMKQLLPVICSCLFFVFFSVDLVPSLWGSIGMEWPTWWCDTQDDTSGHYINNPQLSFSSMRYVVPWQGTIYLEHAQGDSILHHMIWANWNCSHDNKNGPSSSQRRVFQFLHACVWERVREREDELLLAQLQGDIHLFFLGTTEGLQNTKWDETVIRFSSEREMLHRQRVYIRDWTRHCYYNSRMKRHEESG